MEYNVDYFIAKFQGIPEGLWTIKRFRDAGSYCANGHCGVIDGEPTAESMALVKVFSDLSVTQIRGEQPFDFGHRHFSVKAVAINDGFTYEYQQPTPKQRILAALYDIKKAQQPEVKERIVYVMVDEPVRELVKAEPIEN